MTVIAGFNLSDKIYLAADTRVTAGNMKIDNVCKIIPIYGKNVLDSPCQNNNIISLSVAGDLEFAVYLSNKIKQAYNKNRLSNDIRELYKTIDDFIKPEIDYWLTNMKKSYDKKCCLLFAGTNASRNKSFNKDKFNKLINDYKAEAQKEEKKFPELEKQFESDSIAQELNKKIKQDSGKTLMQLLTESLIPQIPDYIQEAVSNNQNRIEKPDSFIFSIMINPKNGIYEKEFAEWGELLAYGTNGINKMDIPNELITKFEFTPGKKNNQPHMTEGVMIDKSLKSLAQEKGLGKIGGVTLVNVLMDNKSKMASNNNECTVINGRFYIKYPQKNVPIVLFTQCYEALKKHKSEANL